MQVVTQTNVTVLEQTTSKIALGCSLALGISPYNKHQLERVGDLRAKSGL